MASAPRTNVSLACADQPNGAEIYLQNGLSGFEGSLSLLPRAMRAIFRRYPKAKIDIVWDAIALHSAADIAERREPEVALVHF